MKAHMIFIAGLVITGIIAISVFGMKYKILPSTYDPCSQDDDCGREEYCSRGKCLSYNDCLQKDGSWCDNCGQLSDAGGALGCCTTSKVFDFIQSDGRSVRVNVCMDLEKDQACRMNQQCKSGQCNNKKCT